MIDLWVGTQHCWVRGTTERTPEGLWCCRVPTQDPQRPLYFPFQLGRSLWNVAPQLAHQDLPPLAEPFINRTSLPTVFDTLELGSADVRVHPFALSGSAIWDILGEPLDEAQKSKK